MIRRRVLAALLFTLCVPACIAAQQQKAQDDAKQESAKVEAWQQEFDAVCGKTQDAMSFTTDQLKSLVQRCDVLQPRIEKLDETRRKVYLRRLQQCRGLYAYVLESKTVDAKDGKK